MLAIPKHQTIYTQWDEADAVFYVQKGKVKLTVVSKIGKEATIGILGERKFLGKARLQVRFSVWDPQLQ
jgi:CRP/FNR family transcriptional regulator, cyclic AMP receptor protein